MCLNVCAYVCEHVCCVCVCVCNYVCVCVCDTSFTPTSGTTANYLDGVVVQGAVDVHWADGGEGHPTLGQHLLGEQLALSVL